MTRSKASASSGPDPPHKPHASNTAAGELLLERLRILITRLNEASDICQGWPESDGDSAKIHAETATNLIKCISKIARALRSIERHVNGTGPSNAEGAAEKPGAISKESLESFRTSLDEKCPIPLDLLDLLDVGNPFGMNPQCYARGLMKEAMRQLAGLERRKRTLDMLGKAIERGLEERVKAGSQVEDGVKKGELADSDATTGEIGESNISSKRKREDDSDTLDDDAKKTRLDGE